VEMQRMILKKMKLPRWIIVNMTEIIDLMMKKIIRRKLPF
jgi:hypothetical protein